MFHPSDYARRITDFEDGLISMELQPQPNDPEHELRDMNGDDADVPAQDPATGPGVMPQWPTGWPTGFGGNNFASGFNGGSVGGNNFASQGASNAGITGMPLTPPQAYGQGFTAPDFQPQPQNFAAPQPNLQAFPQQQALAPRFMAPQPTAQALFGAVPQAAPQLALQAQSQIQPQAQLQVQAPALRQQPTQVQPQPQAQPLTQNQAVENHPHVSVAAPQQNRQ